MKRIGAVLTVLVWCCVVFCGLSPAEQSGKDLRTASDASLYVAVGNEGDVRAYSIVNGSAVEAPVPQGWKLLDDPPEHCVGIVFKKGNSVPSWIPLLGGKHKFEIDGHICGAFDCQLNLSGGVGATVQLGDDFEGGGKADVAGTWQTNSGQCKYVFDEATVEVAINLRGDIPAWVFTIPAVVEIKIGASVGGQVKGTLGWNGGEFPAFPNTGSLAVSPELGVFGKAKFAGGLVEGKVRGTGTMTAQIDPDGFGITRVGVHVVASAQAGWLKYQWDSKDKWIIVLDGSGAHLGTLTDIQENEGVLTITVSAFVGTGAVYSGTPILADVSGDLRNEGRPTLAFGNDLLLASWTQDASATDVAMGSALVVAEYLGNGWTAPVQVSPNTQFNRDPALAFDGNRDAVLVWASAPANVTVDSATGEIIAAMDKTDLFYGVRHDGVWSVPAPVAVEPGRDAEVKTCSSADGHILAAWTHWNEDGASIRTAFLNGSSWSSAAVISATGAEAPACVFMNNTPVVVWSQDTDGDPGTTDDRKLCASSYSSSWSAPEVITDATGADVSPALCRDATGAHLVWERGGSLWHAWGDESGWTTTGRIPDATGSDPVLVSDGDGSLLAWQRGYDNDSEIMLTRCQVQQERPYDLNTDGTVDNEDLLLFLSQDLSNRSLFEVITALSERWHRAGTIPVAHWCAPVVLASTDTFGDTAPALARMADGSLAAAWLKRNWDIDDDTDLYYKVTQSPACIEAPAPEPPASISSDAMDIVTRRVKRDMSDGMAIISRAVPSQDSRLSGTISVSDIGLWDPPASCCVTETPMPTATPTTRPGPNELVINIPGLAAGAKQLTLVRIPKGSFQMGSPDTERSRWGYEGPVHTVQIGYDFYMGKWEVTQAQWAALMGTNPASGYGVGNDYPVYYVSWNDILGSNGFIEKLNGLGQGTFLLPSESEWEYACRAGTTTRFFFGDSLGCSDESEDCAAGSLPGNRSDYMWYWGNSSVSYRSSPVGTKLPNQFGLFDMSGNVWEWCYDDWHDSYTGAPTDGSAWVDSPRGSHRVLRVGGWFDRAGFCRSAYRGNVSPDDRNLGLGFRVVRTQ